MSTSTDCTTVTRYCLHCSEALELDETPAGEQVLACPSCYHSVMLSTAEESTLAEPRKLRQTLRRTMTETALDVARELCARQTGDGWSDNRQGQFSALLVVVDALRERNPGALRRLLEVA